MGFGDRLRQARKAKGLQQEAVAEKFAVTKTTVSKWENDVHSPSVQQIRDLCTLLGVTPDWLFEWARDDLPLDAVAEARAFMKLPTDDRRRWRALRKAAFSTVD